MLYRRHWRPDLVKIYEAGPVSYGYYLFYKIGRVITY